jgi:predicted transcriptional regulator
MVCGDRSDQGGVVLVRRLGELEAEIMDRLWTWQRPATVREIVDDLNLKRPVAYTTVKTVADILHGKGLLRRDHQQDRAWLYAPELSRSAYTAALMREALEGSQDRPAALAHFLQDSSPDEVDTIRALLAQHTPENHG